MKDLRYKFVTMVVQDMAQDIIGGYENSVADGHLDKMPSREQLEQEVYTAVMDTDRVKTADGWRPVKQDIRFLGTPTLKLLVSIITERTLEDS